MTKGKKWFHHCPICGQFVSKKQGRLVTKAQHDNKQCWHESCLTKLLKAPVGKSEEISL